MISKKVRKSSYGQSMHIPLWVGCARVCLLLALTATLLAAQELLTDWSGELQAGDGCFVVNGRQFLTCRKVYTVEEGASYLLSGEFKAAACTDPNLILFGIMCFDKERKVIHDIHVNAIKDTETVLYEDAIAGAQKIKIADGTTWSKGRLVMFNTYADLSDLPNRNVSDALCRRIFTRKDYAEVILSEPLTKNYPKNTGVRQTMRGGYDYVGGIFASPFDWKQRASTINKFWPGTVTFQIILLVNYDASKTGNSVLEFKNIRLEKTTPKE